MENTSESTTTAAPSTSTPAPSTTSSTPVQGNLPLAGAGEAKAPEGQPQATQAKPNPLDALRGQLEGLDEQASQQLIQAMLEKFPVRVKRKGQEVAITDFAKLKQAAELQNNWGAVGNEIAAERKAMQAERERMASILEGRPEALSELLNNPQALEHTKRLLFERMQKEQAMENMDPATRQLLQRSEQMETKLQQFERERAEQEQQAMEAEKQATLKASNQKIQAKLMSMLQSIDMPVSIFEGVDIDFVRALERNLRLDEPEPPEAVAARFKEGMYEKQNWLYEKSVLSPESTAKQKLAAVSPKVSEALAWAFVEENPAFEQKVAARMLDRVTKAPMSPKVVEPKQPEQQFDEEHWRRVRNGIIY